MANSKKGSTKPTVKVEDLQPHADPKGGGSSLNRIGSRDPQLDELRRMKPPGEMGSIGSTPSSEMNSMGPNGEQHRKRRR